MPLALFAGLLVASCAYEFPRGADQRPGELSGRALRTDRDVVAPGGFAKITRVATARAHRTRADGAFVIGGLEPGTVLLRFDDDADGDGWPEYGGFAGVTMPTNPDGSVGFVLLGDVPMRGTMTIRGQVLIDDGGAGRAPAELGLIARVYVLRGQCFPPGGGAVADQADCAPDLPALGARIETGIEAETAVDAQGDFELTGILSGQAEVAVLVYEPHGGALGPVVDAAGPIVAQGQAGGTVSLEPIPLPSARPPLGERDVDLAVEPALPGGQVFLSPAGQLVTCADVTGALRLDVSLTSAALHRISVPVGAWNVTVCSLARSGYAGTFLALPATSPLEPPPVWPVFAIERDLRVPCINDAGEIDCDEDGLQAIPLLVESTRALWEACASQCVDPVAGRQLVARDKCTVIDEVFDCDDDGDGQPDVTEPNECLGPFRGTDLDGDFICSPNDPFPQCAANDPVLCAAGTNDVTPGDPLAPVDPTPPPEGTWIDGTPLPSPLGRAASAVVFPGTAEETVFVLGGFDEQGALDPNAHHVYDRLTDTWLTLDDTPPEPSFSSFEGRVGHTVIFDDFPREGPAFGFVIGGVDVEGVAVPLIEELAVSPLDGGVTLFPIPHSPRSFHTSSFVGLVEPALVSVGGFGADSATPLASAEAAFLGEVPAALSQGRAHHAAVAVVDTLWVIGGVDANGAAIASVESLVYIESPASLEPGPLRAALPAGVIAPAALAIEDGARILVTGGCAAVDGGATRQLALIDTTTAAVTDAGALRVARCGHTLTALPDGRFLVAGGGDGLASPIADAEILAVAGATVTSTPAASLGIARVLHQAHRIGDEVFVVGGVGPGETALAELERFALSRP
jgi:hypothetical protein